MKDLLLHSFRVLAFFLFLLPVALPGQATPYSHGDPTDEEQLFLEFINRARSSIDAEVDRLTNTDDPDVLNAIDFFDVDLQLMADQFENLKGSNGNSQMPLAFNAKLIEAGRLHSEDMFISVFQGHEGSSNALDPNEPGEKHPARITKQGYEANGSAENVFSASRSVWHGHAGFNIDWGNGPGGIQSPPGHRQAIHANGRREAGIGVVLGRRDQSERPIGTSLFQPSMPFSDVGPVLVTQLFAKQKSSTGFDVPFLTGVAYLDIDGNDFYSLNEGLAEIKIEVDGADFYAETSGSGGYAIPLPNELASYTITVSGPGFDSFTEEVTVPANLDNIKWDYSPAFTLPAPSGGTTLTAGSNSSFTFGEMPGAGSYRVRVSALDNSAWTEGAENGETAISISTTEGYDVIQSQSVNNGSFAFRLATVSGSFDDQIIEINRDIIPGPGSEIQYSSRQGLTTPDQISKVELSTDGGTSWTTIETQAGTSSSESSFSTRTIDLADYVNKPIQIRFVFSFGGGQVFTTPEHDDSGWFFDDITVTNSSQISESALTDVASPEFDFTPPSPGDFMLEATGVSGQRAFPFGGPLFVSASGDGGSGGSLEEAISGDPVFVNETDPAVYFEGARSFEDDGFPNWWATGQFGTFQIEHFPWIYHARMGYIFLFGPGNGGRDIFFYNQDLETFNYTNGLSVFPYFYDFTNDHWWYFYEEGSSPTGTRHYFSFKENPANESGYDGWMSVSSP